MRRKQTPAPTAGELEILNIIWRRGPSTVKDVHEEMQRTRPALYTTVLKLMQIMTDKGILMRDETARAHVYRPAAQPSHTRKRLLEDLIDRAFGGSAARLVLQALETRPASTEELREIRELMDRHEGKTK